MKKYRGFRLLFAVAISFAIVLIAASGYAQTMHVAPPAVIVKGTPRHNPPPAVTYSKGAEPQTTKYDCGDPTGEEQYIIELINRARANPKVEGDSLFKTTDPQVSNSFIVQQPPSRLQVKSEFALYPSRPPLACNAQLLAAARAHSKNMLDYGYQSHDGQDGNLTTRLTNAGYSNFMQIGENIFDYGETPYTIHASFQCDLATTPTSATG